MAKTAVKEEPEIIPEVITEVSISALRLLKILKKTVVAIDKRGDRKYLDGVCFETRKDAQGTEFLVGVATDGYLLVCSETPTFRAHNFHSFTIPADMVKELITLLPKHGKVNITAHTPEKNSDRDWNGRKKLTFDMDYSGEVSRVCVCGQDDNTYPDWRRVFTPIHKMIHSFSIDAETLFDIVKVVNKIPKCQVGLGRVSGWIERKEIVGKVKCDGSDFILSSQQLYDMLSKRKPTGNHGLLHFHTLKKRNEPIAVTFEEDEETFCILMNHECSELRYKIKEHNKKVKEEGKADE